VSAWNTAGTWEDRKLKADQLNKVLLEFWDSSETKGSLEASHGLKLVPKVIKGEGSLITVRGKRKLGYDLTVEITVKRQD